MKKFLNLFFILFLCGCSNKTINIENIQNINYDNININEKELTKMQTYFENLTLKKDDTDLVTSNLTITTNDKIHNFMVKKNNIFYKDEEKTYLVANSQDIIDILNDTKQKYIDFSFFNMTYDNCSKNENDLFIKISNSDKCLKIETKKTLLNFKIHMLDIEDPNLSEKELVYENEEIDNTVIIKADVSEIPSIKISFNTQYNFNLSLIPIYSNQKLNSNLSFKQKN